MIRRRSAAAILTLCAIFALAACGPKPQPVPYPVTTLGPDTPSTTAPEPTTSPTPTPTASAGAEPKCDTLISSTVTDKLHAAGWEFRVAKFFIGPTEIPGGLVCTWGDYTGPANDNVQVFGWAKITPSQASTAQNDLVTQGWLREDSPEGIYITENAANALHRDENGYGTTYLFGDGWVKYSDTKQGLLLITWPQ